jgi:hypothetical protein
VANHQRLIQKKQDEYKTRAYAILPLLKYVNRKSVIWCPFDKPESNFVKVFSANGYKVVNSHIETGQNFFEYEPKKYDVIISNPPYSLRESILERLFSLGKPFAMLINDAGLFDSKKRFQLLSSNQFEVMVFDCRIDYIKDGVTKNGVPFKSIYLCSGVLPAQFVFEHIAHLTPRALDAATRRH